MAIRLLKPTTPSRRGMTTQDSSSVTAKKPAKSLLLPKTSKTGRNAQGKITSRRRGGGVKRHYRLVDFKQLGLSGKVVAIEYDPNRSAYIALIEGEGGRLSYVLAHSRAKVGQSISSGEDAGIKSGNRLPLKLIPTGSTVFNIEVHPGKGGQLVRSAGARAQLTAKEGRFVHIRLPSGEIRLIDDICYATLGSVSNEQHQNIKWGSAGRRRRLGRRPKVRGKAMNPADHPMGGGEGLSGPGRLPRTPWGALAMGRKTRRKRRSGRLIVRKRQDKRR